jgi:amino acid transporter
VGFTLAGLTTSALLGGALGYLGEALGARRAGATGVIVALVVASVAAVRELGWIPIPLLQARRQTAGRWMQKGSGIAAVLWGLDLGLFGTTWLTFAGAWLIPVLALFGASPTFGAALFGAYWLGRAASVWIGPLLLPTALDTPRLLDALMQRRRMAQLVHVGGLTWAIVILALMTAGPVAI